MKKYVIVVALFTGGFIPRIVIFTFNRNVHVLLLRERFSKGWEQTMMKNNH